MMKNTSYFSLEELKVEKITKQTLVWTENMADWEEAGNIAGLNIILPVTPPPTPKERETSNTQSSTAIPIAEVVNEPNEVINNKAYLISYFNSKIIEPFFLIVITIAWIICLVSGTSKYWLQILIGLQTVATIDVLFGLKKYLNELNDHDKSNNIIYITICIAIVSAIYLLITSRD